MRTARASPWSAAVFGRGARSPSRPGAGGEVSVTSGREVASALQEGLADVTVHEPDLHLAEELLRGSIDVVFPALDGQLDEDGSSQGMVEVAGVPYVGSGGA